MKQISYLSISALCYAIVIGSILLTSCRHSDSHDEQLHEGEAEMEDHDDHDHEEEKLTYTLFNNEYELFVELAPLVKGEKSEFLTHITNITNYTPVTSGEITVSLIQDNVVGKYTTDSLIAQGIFLPVLQPKESGECRLIFEYKDFDSVASFEINGLEIYATHELEPEEEHEAENKNEITFLKEQAWKTEFGIKVIKRGAFREVINSSGQILPANGDEATIVAPFAGIVVLEKALMAGTAVKKGQSMVKLSGKGMVKDNYSVQSAEIKSNYEKAKSNFERSELLIADKIISQREFLEAKTEYVQAKAAWENVFSSEKGVSKIVSSLNGFVKDVKVKDGQFVEAGTPLFVVAQNKRLIIRADVSQNHWKCLAEISEANFITPYDSRLYNTSELSGRLVSYSRNAVNSAWSIPVFFEVSNKGSLISGSYIEVYLLSKPKADVISIPKSALIEEQGNFYVFIQLSGESYLKRQVKTGIENGREIEIVAGLNEGDVVVTKGAYQLKLASVSSALPSHNHAH